jgi:hypothetical protein
MASFRKSWLPIIVIVSVAEDDQCLVSQANLDINIFVFVVGIRVEANVSAEEKGIGRTVLNWFVKNAIARFQMCLDGPDESGGSHMPRSDDIAMRFAEYLVTPLFECLQNSVDFLIGSSLR